MESVTNNNDVRCTVCLKEFNYSVDKTCPVCKTIWGPTPIANDLMLKVNWQEMRILANYAIRWAEAFFDMTNKGDVDAMQALKNTLQNWETYQPKGAIQLITPKEKIEKSTEVKSPYFKKKKI